MNKNGFLVSVLLFVLFVPSASFAQFGLPDSTCPIFTWTGDHKLWRIDADVNDVLSDWSVDGTFISYLDSAIVFDQAMQNLTRWSRQRSRQRILAIPDNPDECSALDLNWDACITTHSNTETALCRDNPFALAWGGCSLLGLDCTVMLCEDNVGGVDYGSGSHMIIFMHELGHALGVSHPDRFLPQRACAVNPPVQCGLGDGWTCNSNLCTCTLNADCGQDGICAFGECNYPNCTGSDGCGGELMCSEISFIRGATITGGDGKGLRNKSHGSDIYFNRRVFVGRRSPGGQSIGFDLLESPRRFSTFNPRIDCALAPTFAQCIAVFTFMDNGVHSTRVVRLDDWDGSTFATNNSRHRFATDHLFPADVATDDGGNSAWVVSVSQGNSNTFIRHINMLTMQATVASLGYQSMLPPRVVYSPILDMALILGAEAAGGGTRWRLDAAFLGPPGVNPRTLPGDLASRVTPINADTLTTLTMFSSLRTKSVDLGTMDDSPSEGSTFFPAADFDFDCLDSASMARTRCTIVAVLHNDGGNFVGAEQQGRLWRHAWSREFTFDGGNTAALTSDWISSQNDLAAQSIQGVARTASKLLVSIGIQGDTQPANTRHVEFAGASVSQQVFSRRYTADAESCDAPGDTGGFTMAGSTPWGGSSMDYCWSCGSGGRIISLNLGRRSDGDNLCF